MGSHLRCCRRPSLARLNSRRGRWQMAVAVRARSRAHPHSQNHQPLAASDSARSARTHPPTQAVRRGCSSRIESQQVLLQGWVQRVQRALTRMPPGEAPIRWRRRMRASRGRHPQVGCSTHARAAPHGALQAPSAPPACSEEAHAACALVESQVLSSNVRLVLDLNFVLHQASCLCTQSALSRLGARARHAPRPPQL